MPPEAPGEDLEHKTGNGSTPSFQWALSELLKPVPDASDTAGSNGTGVLHTEPPPDRTADDTGSPHRQHVTEEEFRKFGYPPMPD